MNYILSSRSQRSCIMFMCMIVKSVKYCKRHQLRRVSTLLLFIGIFLEKKSRCCMAEKLLFFCLMLARQVLSLLWALLCAAKCSQRPLINHGYLFQRRQEEGRRSNASVNSNCAQSPPQRIRVQMPAPRTTSKFPVNKYHIYGKSVIIF